jgi:hypothetical protein
MIGNRANSIVEVIVGVVGGIGIAAASKRARAHPSVKALSVSTVGAVLACIVSGISQPAMAQSALAQGAAGVPAFAPGMINHMQAMRRFKDRDQGAQPTPNVIPKFEIDRDASGAIASFQPDGQTFTKNNAFFQKPWNQWEDLLHLPSTG